MARLRTLLLVTLLFRCVPSPAQTIDVEKLKGAARLRPDSKLVISREWPTGEARLQGALQISRGLMRVLAAAEKKELEPA